MFCVKLLVFEFMFLLMFHWLRLIWSITPPMSTFRFITISANIPEIPITVICIPTSIADIVTRVACISVKPASKATSMLVEVVCIKA